KVYMGKDGVCGDEFTATEDECRRYRIEKKKTYISKYINLEKKLVEDSYVFWMLSLELLLQIADEKGFDFYNPSPNCYVNLREELKGTYRTRDRKELEEIRRSIIESRKPKNKGGYRTTFQIAV